MTATSKIKYDDGLMRCAISPGSKSAGGPEDRGYIHRRTGQIIFLASSDSTASAWHGETIAAQQKRDRAVMEKRPEDWLLIPQCPDEDQDTFISQFLTQNGLES